MDEWTSVLAEELGAHQRLSDAIDECEVLRTPSSTSSSDAASDRSGRASSWWAVVLQAAGRAAGLDDSAASQSEAIRLVSACTGFGAEAWVLKGLGMPFDLCSASEKSDACRSLFLANFPQTMHMYGSIEEQVASTPCLSCASRGLLCKEAVENCAPSCLEGSGQGSQGLHGPIGLLISGSPCDPFSVNRMGKRWAPGDVEAHASYDVTMRSLVRLYTKYSPVVGIMEQVSGFNMPCSSSSSSHGSHGNAEISETPCSRFLASMAAAAMPHRYWVAKLELDAKIWLAISRPRCYLVFFRKDKFSREEVSNFKKLVQVLLQWVENNHSPLALTSLMLEECSPAFQEHFGAFLASRLKARPATPQTAESQWPDRKSVV